MITLRDIKKEDAYYIFNWKQDPYLQEMAIEPNYKTTLEEQEEDMLKQTEKILDRIQQVQEQRALEKPKVLEKGLFA